MSKLTVGNHYRFTIYPTSMYSGRNFEKVQITAEISGSIARTLGYDIDALHAQAYADLPSGTTNSPDSYNYYIYKTTSGQTNIIGEAWINESTIQSVQSVVATFVVSNIDSSDVPRIKELFAANNYASVSVTTVVS